MKLTKNITLKELSCRCGCAAPTNVVTNLTVLAILLQRIRDYYNAPIIINSGYRCISHNTKVGGASRSYHLSGMAADFTIKGMSPAAVYKKVHELMDSGVLLDGGLGKYKTFTHYDFRIISTRF